MTRIVRTGLAIVAATGLAIAASVCGSNVSAPPPASSASAHQTQAPHSESSSVPSVSWETALESSAGQAVHLTCQGTEMIAPATAATTFRLSEAFDPHNNETDQQDTLTVAAGPESETVTTALMVIGTRVWVESTPPGGGWHQESVGVPRNPVAFWDKLTDVHPVPGLRVAGRPTVGWSGILSAQGLAGLLPSTGAKTTAETGTAVTYRFYVGPKGHVREVVMHLTTASGFAETMTCLYQQYGQGLNLSPPTS
jgi:hypothetical protein